MPLPNQPLKQINQHAKAIDTWRVLDEFDSTYWSGLSMRVFADNVYVDDVIQFNFQLLENVRPYYHYSSYVADVLHHGTRIITGEFTMNFQRDKFIPALISTLTNPGVAGRTDEVLETLSKGLSNMFEIPGPVVEGEGAESVTLEKISEMSPEAIIDLREKLRKPSSPSSPSINIPVTRGVFQTRREGFNLSVVLGGHIGDSVLLKYRGGGKYSFTDFLAPTDNAIVPGTGIMFLGTSIVGSARSMADDGRNIMETYTFQARDFQVIDITPTNPEQEE